MDGLEWIDLPNIELPTGVIGIAEVRDGPSDDMFVVRLEGGIYRPCLGLTQGRDDEIGALRVVDERALGGWTVRTEPGDLVRGGVIGWMSTSLAMAGVFDYELLHRMTVEDRDGYGEWKAGFFDGMSRPYGCTAFGGDNRATVFYAHGPIGNGHHAVSEILKGDEPVGVEVAFSPRVVAEIDSTGPLRIERIRKPIPLAKSEAEYAQPVLAGLWDSLPNAE